MVSFPKYPTHIIQGGESESDREEEGAWLKCAIKFLRRPRSTLRLLNLCMEPFFREGRNEILQGYQMKRHGLHYSNCLTIIDYRNPRMSAAYICLCRQLNSSS